MYCAVSHSDLAEVVDAVRGRTTGPLLAVGVSLGGLILGHYLAEHGESSAVDAALVVSSPLDVVKGTFTDRSVQHLCVYQPKVPCS